jgi:pimeloyl-ACP methyl ester carboxylesterase
MLNLAFLPATAPGDKSYGEIPNQLRGQPASTVRRVTFPRLVWYNPAVRDEAVAQIRAWGVAPIVLVGFSKSGLGAWNIARAIPELVSATIIFDAPVARRQLPPWGTSPFYSDDRAWQTDLPIGHLQQFASAVSPSHQLLLIAGANFADEMRALSQALRQLGHTHVFLDRPATEHHWNSGWIEEGLRNLAAPYPAGNTLPAAPAG